MLCFTPTTSISLLPSMQHAVLYSNLCSVYLLTIYVYNMPSLLSNLLYIYLLNLEQEGEERKEKERKGRWWEVWGRWEVAMEEVGSQWQCHLSLLSLSPSLLACFLFAFVARRTEKWPENSGRHLLPLTPSIYALSHYSSIFHAWPLPNLASMPLSLPCAKSSYM